MDIFFSPWFLRWYNIPHHDHIFDCDIRALRLISRKQFQNEDLLVIKVQRNAIVFMDLMNCYKFTEKIYCLPHSLREVMHPLCTSKMLLMLLTDFVWAYFIVPGTSRWYQENKCPALLKTLSMLVQKRDNVESLFFMRDLCSRLWVTFALKLHPHNCIYRVQAFK